MRSLGVTIERSTPEYVKVTRRTRETEVVAEISLTKRDLSISTGIGFLDHMIEQLSWYACMSIGITVKCLKNRKLTHTVAEDAGLTLGYAFKELYIKRMNIGLNSAGSAYAAIDEALALAVISIEGRSNAFINAECEGAIAENVEDLRSKDLIAFIEGLAQGMRTTIHIHILQGKDPHHTWEATFRSLGWALREAFNVNEWRKGGIAGIKGTLD